MSDEAINNNEATSASPVANEKDSTVLFDQLQTGFSQQVDTLRALLHQSTEKGNVGEEKKEFDGQTKKFLTLSQATKRTLQGEPAYDKSHPRIVLRSLESMTQSEKFDTERFMDIYDSTTEMINLEDTGEGDEYVDTVFAWQDIVRDPVIFEALHDPAYEQKAWEILNRIVKEGTEGYEEGFVFLDQNFEQLVENHINPENLEKSLRTIQFINHFFKELPYDDPARTYDQLALLSKKNSTLSAGFTDDTYAQDYINAFGQLLATGFIENDLDYINAFSPAIQIFLEKHQLPFREILNIWRENAPENNLGGDINEMTDIGFLIEENMKTIHALETSEERSGSAKFLYDNFHIVNFGRYPAELLMEQYDFVTNPDSPQKQTPYGFIMYPYVDHNGAFVSHKDVWNDIFAELKGEYAIIVTEGQREEDITEFLKIHAEKFGPATFFFLGGHGKTNFLEVGPGKEGIITSDDIKKWFIQENPDDPKIFVDHPSGVLISCSTGAKGGLAEQTAAFGVDMTGPDVDTYPEKIHSQKDEQSRLIGFSVDYNNAKTNRFNQKK